MHNPSTFHGLRHTHLTYSTRSFYYLSGADFADCAVTYDIARDNLILWIPYTDPRQALWFGKTPSPEECKSRTSVSDVRYIIELPRYLRRYLSSRSASSGSSTTTVYILHPSQPPPHPEFLGSRGILQIDTVSLQPAMDAARVIKSTWEIAAIRRANAVSSAAHRAVLTRLKKMTNEREIEALFRGYCIAVGAKKTAYGTIAGAGPNAATLHYDANNEPLAGRQLVVLDAGAEWSCYASDVTRTLPIGGKFTKEGKAIYSVVEKMQESCIRAIRPGFQFVWLHVHAMTIAVSELLKLGILKGSAKEILAAGTGAAFFPHGLGHHVGLEVHDVSGRERLMVGAGVRVKARGGGLGKREMFSPEMMAGLYRAGMVDGRGEGRAKLEKGMVVTVEPGM
jgi:Xaa-Pro dipeptidase